MVLFEAMLTAAACRISSNGHVIVRGRPWSAPGHVDAYRWTSSQGLTWMGSFWPPSPNEGVSSSMAYAASGIGSTIVGSTHYNLHHVINLPVVGYMGFAWSRTGGATKLSWLSGPEGNLSTSACRCFDRYGDVDVDLPDVADFQQRSMGSQGHKTECMRCA